MSGRSKPAQQRFLSLFALWTALFALTLVLSGCSVGYITSSAWTEAKILFNRRPIAKLLAEAQSSGTESSAPNALSAQQLKLLASVPRVREFARVQLKLNVGEAYSSFVAVPSDSVSWILMAAKKDRFELKTWWFPIVGTVPYKGFGSENDAKLAGDELQKDGFETWVRPAAAFSTLGWFNDPVVSSMLEHGAVALTNTVIHELVHRTFWVKNDVAFNETAANVIGTYGAVQFFESETARCAASKTALDKAFDCDATYQNELPQLLAQARADFAQSRVLAAALAELHADLSALYALNSSAVLTERDAIFVRWQKKYLSLAAHWNALNNARLMQALLYYTRFNELADFVQSATIKKAIATISQSETPWRILNEQASVLKN